MATDSVRLGGAAAPAGRAGVEGHAGRRSRPHLLSTLQGRIYLTLGFLILLTLGIAGVAFFFLLGGYQDRLAASTLRQIGGPVYLSVVTPPGSDFQAFEVSRQLATSATVGGIPLDPDVRILFVDGAGAVVSEASGAPRFLGEQLGIDFSEAGTDTFIEGRLTAGDQTRLDYLAAALSNEASDRFGAEFVVLALPVAGLAVRHAGRLSSAIERASFTGYALPGIVVALALVFFGANYAGPVYQTVWLLVFAYVVLFLPAALGAVRSTLVQISPRLEEAARGLGSRPLQVMTGVTLPLLRPGLLAGAALVFLITMKELPATLILGPLEFNTLATSIWSAADEAFFARAAAPALILILTSSVPMAFLVVRDGRARP